MRASNTRQKRTETALRRRRIRSAASSQNSSGDASSSDSGMDNFSFDLAKLGEKASGLSIGNGKREAELMGSEDDGPEDFTLNMAKWMSGKAAWQEKTGKDLDGSSGDDEDKPKETNEPVQQNYERDNDADVKGRGPLEQDEINYEAEDESEFLPWSTSTPGLLRSRAQPDVQDIPQEAEKLENIHAPPLTRLNTEAKHDRAAEEVFDRISALQEDVERMRVEDEDRRYEHNAHEMAYQQLQEDYENLKIELQNERRKAAEWQASQIRTKEEEATSQQEALRRDAETRIGSFLAKIEPLTQELDTVRSEAEASKRAADAEIAALKEELRASQNENTRHRNGAGNGETTTSTLIKQLRSELETSRSETAFEQKRYGATTVEHTVAIDSLRNESQAALEASKSDAAMLRFELEHAQEQLTETRRIVAVVEDENDRLTQENERQATDIIEVRAMVKEDDDKLDAAESTIEKLQSVIESLDAEKEARLRQIEDHDSLEQLNSQHQESLDQLRSDHGKALVETQSKHSQELKTLQTTLLKAAEGMRKREARLTTTHRNKVDSLKEDVETLKQRLNAQKQPQSSPPDTEKVPELRNAIRLLSQQLSTTKSELATTKTELASTQIVLTTTKTDLAAARTEKAAALNSLSSIEDSHAAVNKALESRFASVIEAREKEWRRRMAVLFREREKMGKALMLGWGREEMGFTEAAENQKYRYRYAN